MAKRIACYVRVSTVGQNEAGQVQALKSWLDGHDATSEAAWFIDKESGDTLKRPAFERLQTAVFNGEIQTVVVFKLDRLSRSLRDGIATLCDWCDKRVRVVSVTQQLDFSGATGQLVASVLFAVAQMEQETRKERQAVGIEVAKESGKYLGRKPGTTKGKPYRAHRLRAKGLTYEEIGSALGVSARTVRRYLRTTAPESPVSAA